MIKRVVCRHAPATDSVVQLEWEKLESVSVSASENRSTSYQMELSLISKLTHCLNMKQKQNLTHYEDPPVCTVHGKVPDKDSNHIYCPQLALNLVENIYKKKKKRRLLDHIKAQMVKADVIKHLHLSAMCKETYVCTEKNCTCSAASMRNLWH